MKNTTVLVLHNIRSTYNIGAIFRTADGAGVSKIYLSGFSPTPLDRFGKKRKDVAKSALGAEEYVPWEYHAQASPVIAKLKREGFTIVAVEQTKTAIDYRSYRSRGKTAFMFGNEVRGLSSAVLKKADKVIEIPMGGKKESLNVSVSAGIILYQCS